MTKVVGRAILALRQQMEGLRQVPIAILAVIVFALALSAAAVVWNVRENPQPLTVAQVNAEYRVEAQGLRLPSGVKWPDASEETGKAPDGGEMRYEHGVGQNDADLYWFEAWAKIAVSSTASEQQEAVRMLSQLYGLPLFSSMDRAAQAGIRQIVTEAQAGDLGGLRKQVAAFRPSK